jgi:CRP/FNR family cyclic AMP-dependent transcriptional regulator
VAVDLAQLAALPLCAGLAEEQVSALALQLHQRAIPAGVTLIMAEQPGEVVYLILSGTVKVSIEQADGTEVILGLHGPGELVGEMSAIDQQGRSANIVTLERCGMLWLDRAAFTVCLQTMPLLAFNVLRLLSRRLRVANDQIVALGSLDVYGRVARQILSFALEYGERTAGGLRIPLRLTQSDLACMVGASRVRVNEVIVAYKRLRYLSIDRQYRITILDQDALARRCQSATE